MVAFRNLSHHKHALNWDQGFALENAWVRKTLLWLFSESCIWFKGKQTGHCSICGGEVRDEVMSEGEKEIWTNSISALQGVLRNICISSFHVRPSIDQNEKLCSCFIFVKDDILSEMLFLTEAPSVMTDSLITHTVQSDKWSFPF